MNQEFDTKQTNTTHTVNKKLYDALTEPFVQERSYLHSAKSGWQLVFRHPLSVLRHLWPTLICSMLVMALVSDPLAEHVWVFGYISMADGITPTDLLHTPLFRLLSWLALPSLLIGIVLGQTAYLTKRYEELSYLPVVQPWKVWRAILPYVRRGITVSLLWCIINVILILIALLIMPTRRWALLFFAISYILLGVLTSHARKVYTLGDMSLAETGKWFLSRTYRREMSSTTALVSVCGLMLIVVISVGCIPALLSTYVGGLAELSEALGDATEMPKHFGIFRGMSFSLATFNTLIAYVLYVIPLYFHYGSMKAHAQK